MNEIVVKKDGEKWAAFYGDRRITRAACKNCIIKVLLTMFKNSTKYRTIKVEDENGELTHRLFTGAPDGRTAS
jgi:hypothetical protein